MSVECRRGCQSDVGGVSGGCQWALLGVLFAVLVGSLWVCPRGVRAWSVRMFSARRLRGICG
eukprot:11909971-Alexandrium_andersonii.AAC.1